MQFSSYYFYGKTSQNSSTILSDFFKHLCVTQFYMQFSMILFSNYALGLKVQENARKLVQLYHIQGYYIILAWLRW